MSKFLHCSAAIALILQVAPTAIAQDTQPNAPSRPASQAPAQGMSDAWITAKVKSALLADENVSGLEIDVRTNAGVVSLSGTVGQQSEIDQARRIAQNIDGVKTVDIEGLKHGAAKR